MFCLTEKKFGMLSGFKISRKMLRRRDSRFSKQETESFGSKIGTVLMSKSCPSLAAFVGSSLQGVLGIS